MPTCATDLSAVGLVAARGAAHDGTVRPQMEGHAKGWVGLTVWAALFFASGARADIAPPDGADCVQERVAGPSDACELCEGFSKEADARRATLAEQGYSIRCIREPGASLWCRSASEAPAVAATAKRNRERRELRPPDRPEPAAASTPARAPPSKLQATVGTAATTAMVFAGVAYTTLYFAFLRARTPGSSWWNPLAIFAFFRFLRSLDARDWRARLSTFFYVVFFAGAALFIARAVIEWRSDTKVAAGQPIPRRVSTEGVDLPRARHAGHLRLDQDDVVVTLRGSSLSIDGDDAGALAPNRVLVDPLYAGLRARRELWRRAHDAEEDPSVVLLVADGDAPMGGIRRLLRTAAGERASVAIGVRGLHPTSDRVDFIDVRAVPAQTQPGWGRPPLSWLEAVLMIDATKDDAFTLRWYHEGPLGDETTAERKEQVATVSGAAVVRYPALEEAIAAAWREHGAHRDRSDLHVEVAQLRVRDALALRGFAALVDAVFALEREVLVEGVPRRTRVFDVMLGAR